MISENIRKNKRKKIVNNIVFLLLCLISFGTIGMGAYNLFKTIYDSKTAGKLYADINSQIFTTDMEQIIQNQNVSYETYTNDTGENISQQENTKNDTEGINWDILLDINDDTKAILYIPRLNVNLPVVLGEDNQYYLSHSIDRNPSSCGTLFFDSRIKGMDDKNLIIYGHNMLNGSMFGSLDRFFENNFIENNSNIYLIMKDKVLTYRIFSVYTTENGSSTYTTRFTNDLNFKNYKKKMYENSTIETDADIDNNSQVLTLSTCYKTGENIRTVVQAQRTD